ncbi:MAG: TolC family protein [Phycisphaerales bacterium JB040]
MTLARRILPTTVVLLALAGCRGPLDSRIDAVVAERSREVHGTTPRSIAGSGSYEGTYGEGATSQDPNTAYTPSTVNPTRDELRYTPADEAEDVAAKLTRYAEIGGESDAPDALVITFERALQQAQLTGRDFLSAEETYLLSAIRLLIERHNWSPRFFNDTSVELSGFSDDGDFDHALSIINTLRVTQRLPFGGSVEASYIVRATDQLRESATQGYTSSNDLVLSGSVPLLRGFGTVARESRIQAERDLVYAARDFERFRRTLLVDIASDYFNLLASRDRITNQLRDLDAQQRRNQETIEKVRAGRLDPYQRDITANAVRQSEASLANQRESYILQLERFKIRLGLDPDTQIRIADLEFDLSPPAIDPDLAASLALEYRLDLQNQRDRLADTERDVSNARNDLLPDLDLAASVGTGSDPDNETGGFTLDPQDLDYSVSMSLGLPLDRTQERLGLRSALISRDRSRRDYEESRDLIVVDARTAVRQIDLARFRLELAEDQILINERGLEALRLRDDADPQSILDRQNALLEARNSRDQNRTDLRNAILNYLLITGQLRVSEDGTFQPLPGMSPVMVPADQDRDDAGDDAVEPIVPEDPLLDDDNADAIDNDQP